MSTCLIMEVLTGKDTGRQIAVPASGVVLGRGSDCDIPFEEPTLSRRHCRISREMKTEWVIQDLQSRCGVIVNGQKTSGTPLKQGDEIKLGQLCLTVVSLPAPKVPPLSPSSDTEETNILAASHFPPASEMPPPTLSVPPALKRWSIGLGIAGLATSVYWGAGILPGVAAIIVANRQRRLYPTDPARLGRTLGKLAICLGGLFGILELEAVLAGPDSTATFTRAVIFMGVIGYGVYWLIRRIPESRPKGKFVCRNCGHVGAPKYVDPGGAGGCLVEFLLWCFLIIPGVIYTFWKAFNKVPSCPSCKSLDMISGDSPMGRKLINDLATP